MGVIKEVQIGERRLIVTGKSLKVTLEHRSPGTSIAELGKSLRIETASLTCLRNPSPTPPPTYLI